MIDFATLSEPAQAGVLVGAVLLEAIVLYVGYGALEQVAANVVVEKIKKA